VILGLYLMLFAGGGEALDCNIMTTKQQFLLEHNRLSPTAMRATEEMLSRFRMEKAAIFKDEDWSVEKLRRPFILWMTSQSIQEREKNENSNRMELAREKSMAATHVFNSYPKKRGISAREGSGLQKAPAIPAKSRF
jgi:hypothetical protein